MDWGRAAGLFGILRADPSSAIAAALEGWDHPVSREALIMMDQFDLDHTVAAGGKKVDPHPGRPWERKQADRGLKPHGMTPGEARAALRAAAAGEL